MPKTMSEAMTAPFLGAAVLATVAVPMLVFLLCGLLAGMSPADAVAALVEQAGARTSNPLRSGLAGLIPIALLFMALAIAARFDPEPAWILQGRWMGLVAILVVVAWANFEYWPTFLPDRVYAGFPHGLELVIGPIFFAPVAMVVGLGATRIIARSRA